MSTRYRLARSRRGLSAVHATLIGALSGAVISASATLGAAWITASTPKAAPPPVVCTAPAPALPELPDAPATARQ